MRKSIGTIVLFGIPHDVVLDTFTDQSNALGRWVQGEQTILIRNGSGPELQNATLWHEVVHVILEGVGESELGKNEDFVEKISLALSQIADLKVNYKSDV